MSVRWMRPLGLLLGLLVLGGAGAWWWQTSRPEARYQSGRAALARNDWDAVEAQATALETAGHPDQARLLRSESQLRQGRPAEALALLQQLQPQGQLLRQALLIQGRALLELRQLREAYRTFSYLLSEFPEEVEAHRGLAAVTHDLGQMAEAIQHLDEVARLDPRDGKPYRLKGLILKDLGNLESSEEAYRAALQRELPASFRQAVRAELADVLLQQTRYAEALNVLEETTGEPDTPSAARLSAQIEALWRLGRVEEADRLLQPALMDFPRHARLWLLRGRVLLEQRKPTEAVQALRRAAELAPGDYPIRYQLAQALQLASQSEASEQERRKAEELQRVLEEITNCSRDAVERPWDAGLRLRLAELCDRMQRPELAAMWREAARECQAIAEKSR